jgi:hypothetical protein
MLDERCEPAAQRRSVLLARIDLILGAIDPESHRFSRRAPIKIILEFDGYLLCHPGLPAALEISPPRSTVLAAGIRGAGSRLTGCTRTAERDQLSRAPAGTAHQVCPLPTRIVLSYLTL